MKTSQVLYAVIIVAGVSAITYMYYLSDFANETQEK